MNDRLTYEVALQATGEDSLSRITTSLNRMAAAAEAVAVRGTSAFNGVDAAVRRSAQAAEQAEPKWRKLALGMKDLAEGRKTFGAVEMGYFAESLGTAGIAAGVAAAAVFGLAVAYENSKKSAETFRGSLANLALSSRTQNDELKVTNDRLENEIAKLQGKPQNNLKLAIDEAALSADKLQSSLSKAIGELYKTADQGSRGFVNALLHGEIRSTGVGEYLGGLTGVGGLNARIAEAAGDPAKSRKVMTEGLAHLEIMKQGARQSGNGVLSNQRDLELINAATTDLYSRRDYIDETTRNTKDQKTSDQVKSAKELATSRMEERSKEQQMLKGGMDESLAGC